MYISKVHIFFLLIFAGIGNQRTLANPTSRSSKANALNQGAEHNLNCHPESDHTRQQIELIMEMLGEENSTVNTPQTNASHEAVLVLGNTGVGKSSLIQFLIENPELQAYKTENASYYMINDGGVKIGSTGHNYSFTQYPEIFSFNGTTFIDTPGFHGSRSPADEIISMAALKKIISKLKRVKILLLVNMGIPKSKPVDLMNTFRHLDEFVDIDSFLNHTSLIVTKVPFLYRTEPDSERYGGFSYKNKFHVNWWRKTFLETTLRALKMKVSPRLSEQEEKFNETVIKFIHSLDYSSLINNTGEIPRHVWVSTHLDIFQHTDKDMLGSRNKMSFYQSNRQSLYETIKNLEPFEIVRQDYFKYFNFTLSREAESLKQCFKNATTKDYKNILARMHCIDIPKEAKASEIYNEKRINTVDSSKLISFHNKLSNLGSNLRDSYYYQLPNRVRVDCIDYKN